MTETARCEALTVSGAQCKHDRSGTYRFCARHLHDPNFRPTPDNTVGVAHQNALQREG